MNQTIENRLKNLTLLDKDEQLQLRKDILRSNPSRLRPWLWDRKCEINVLLVVDGLNFGVDGFGLSNFVSIFQEMEIESNVVLKYNVTLAHRFDYFVGQTPLINTDRMQAGNTYIHNRIVGFRFDNADHFTQDKYDQVWLFGIGSNYALGSNENDIIEDYMNKGGGLFATGDHGALGVSLCGGIPRVKDMRYWDHTAPAPESEVSMVEHRRNDTNKLKPGETDTNFTNQEDDIPQTIHAKMYNGLPHYLLSAPTSIRPSGIIDIMPDHPHEGEVKPEIEFEVINPKNGNEHTIRTQNIATSFVLGGIQSGAKAPTTPHCFPSIGVFDGRVANVGRIVVDSTWHHFVNINLDGFTVDTMNVVKQYFKNISKWISRKKNMLCIYKRLVVHAFLSERIIESSTLKPNAALADIPLSELFAIGKHAMDLIGEEMTPADAVEFQLAHLEMLAPELATELNPWHPDRKLDADSPHNKWLNTDILSAIAIGTGMVYLRDEFGEINTAITAKAEAKINKVFAEGLRVGMIKTEESFRQKVKSFIKLSDMEMGSDYSIKGIVTDAKGNPMAGLRIKAVDQDFTGENSLGFEVITNEEGKYRITYEQTDFVINGRESGGADIIIYIFNNKGKLIFKTNAYQNSPRNSNIDIRMK